MTHSVSNTNKGLVIILTTWFVVSLYTPETGWSLTMKFPEQGAQIAAVHKDASDRDAGRGVAQASSDDDERSANSTSTETSSGDRFFPRRNTFTEFFDELDTEINGSAYHNDINGNASRSFLVEGTHGKIDLTFTGENRYGKDSVFELNTDLRWTDDPQLLPDKRFEIRGMFGEFRREDDYRFRLGNVSASFSDYSIASSADVGVHLEKTLDFYGFTDLQIYGGRPQRQEGDEFRRFNGGIRLTSENPESWLRSYSLNYVQTYDDEGSISDTASRPDRAIDGEVFSFDGELALSRDWTFDGEFAYSSQDTNTLDSGGEPIEDIAFNLNMQYGLDKWRGFKDSDLSLRFEEVQPDFRSASGGGSPDNRQYIADLRTTYDQTNWLPPLDFQYGFTRNTNNLDDQRPSGTETNRHRVELGFRPYARYEFEEEDWWSQFRKNLSAEVSVRNLFTETDDNTIKRQTNNQDYRLSTRFARQSLQAGYRFRINLNQTPGAADRRERVYIVDYRYSDIELPYVYGPTDINASFNRSEEWERGGPDGSDQTRWSFGLNHELYEDYVFESNWTQSKTANNGPRNDFRRTSWDVSVSTSELTRNMEEFRVSYSINDIDEDIEANEVREEVVRADVQFNF